MLIVTINWNLIEMRHISNRIRQYQGMTITEMIVAMAVMAIVFSAVVPQFRNIQNTWASKQGIAECIQNGRVLMDHLNRQLSKAVLITAVSNSAETDGYIEFQANDATTYRYDIAVNDYVEFGPIGSLTDLAGPVTSLRFTCYSLDDMDTAITDTASIRFITVEATLTNSASMGQDKTISTSAWLRTNASGGSETAYFGNHNIESTNLSGAGIQYASQATLDEDKTITSILAYVKGTATKNMRFAIYTDNAGEPGTLIVETNPVLVGSNLYHWHEVSIAETDLAAGTYWLALAFAHSSINVTQSALGSGRTRHKNYDAVAGGFKSSWGASDVSNTRCISICGAYTTEGALGP